MRWKQTELCRKIDHQLSSPQNWCQLWIISDTFDNICIMIAIFMFYIYKSKYLEKWICRMSGIFWPDWNHQQLIYQLTDSSLKLVKKIKAETSWRREKLWAGARVPDITIITHYDIKQAHKEDQIKTQFAQICTLTSHTYLPHIWILTW